MSNPPFTGFPIKTLQFFTDLANNNNKTWFDTHKPDYESYVLGPARDFVIALGERLRELSPNVVADPRVNKSIFKIFRDVRFSMNKTPYKTNLALWFPVCEGGAKFDKPGYYFQLGRNSLMLGVGIHHFSKELLKGYRDSVVYPVLGPQLAGSLALLIEKGYGVGEKTYKRIPRDCESNHPNAELLLYSGLTSGVETDIPAEFLTPELVDYCFSKFRDLAPIVFWLEAIKERWDV